MGEEVFPTIEYISQAIVNMAKEQSRHDCDEMSLQETSLATHLEVFMFLTSLRCSSVRPDDFIWLKRALHGWRENGSIEAIQNANDHLKLLVDMIPEILRDKDLAGSYPSLQAGLEMLLLLKRAGKKNVTEMTREEAVKVLEGAVQTTV